MQVLCHNSVIRRCLQSQEPSASAAAWSQSPHLHDTSEHQRLIKRVPPGHSQIQVFCVAVLLNHWDSFTSAVRTGVLLLSVCRKTIFRPSKKKLNYTGSREKQVQNDASNSHSKPLKLISHRGGQVSFLTYHLASLSLFYSFLDWCCFAN